MRKMLALALLALTFAGGLTSFAVMSSAPAWAGDTDAQGDEDLDGQ